MLWIIKGIHETLMSISMCNVQCERINQFPNLMEKVVRWKIINIDRVPDFELWSQPVKWSILHYASWVPQIKDQLNMDRILKNLLCRKNSWLLPVSTLQTELTIQNRYGDLGCYSFDSGSNVKRKFKPSIYWCHPSPHPLLSINNWVEQDLRISGGLSSPSVSRCLTWSLFPWRYSLRYTSLHSLLSTLHPLLASDHFSEIKCFSFAVGDLRVSVVVFLN